MNTASFIGLLRQYKAISERKGKSYAPVVDELAAQFKASEAALPAGQGLAPERVDAIVAQEYPERLRSFPLTRT